MNFPLIARLLPVSDRRVTRQTLWMIAITAAQLFGGLAQVTMSARILGPEAFGVLTIITAVTLLTYGLLAIPGGEAVTAFVTRGVAEGRPGEASSVLRFTLAVSLGLSFIAYAVLAILIFASSGLLGIDRVHMNVALLYGVVGIFLATQTETLATLRLSDRLPLGLAVVVAGAVTRIALLAAAWLTGGGLLAVVLAYIAGAAVNGVGLLVATTVSAPRSGMTSLLSSLSLRVPSDVVRFQTGAFGKSAIWVLAHNLDSVLLAQFAGAAEVGMYRGARYITDSTRYPFLPLKNAVQPEYSRQWHSGRGAALRRSSLRFALASFTLAATGYGLLAVFHQPITRVILGAEFSGAAPLALIMVIGSFVSSCVSTLTILPAAAGRVWPSLAGSGIGLVSSLAIIVWLAPSHGAVGAAWANTAYFIAFVAVVTPSAISILRQSRYIERNSSGRVLQLDDGNAGGR